MTCLATAVACGGGGAPELIGLTDQVAQVGTELKIDLVGTDPDGDQLQYGFRAAGLDGVEERATISVSPSGTGVFRWTPLAQDLGQHAFDFVVSDGDHDTTVTINIDVRSAVGSATAPVFRQPLGTGTTLDLRSQQCVELDVVVEDQDTAQVTLAIEDPAEGMELEQHDGLTATFRWCPTREQEAESRYTIALSADDGDNPKVIKNYLLVLRTSGSTDCPGDPPVISHTPENMTTIVDLTIDATVTDDRGLKEAPLFYYSLTNPGATPNLGPGGMTQLSMIQISGSSTNGLYAADVPNPVAGMPAGAQRTLYYVIVADDDDDETGSCDHLTQSQVYQMTVTSSGSADLELCAPCSSDAQCGAGDLCAYVGSLGESYCLQACGSGCPSGYTCSAQDVWSVDWNTARQCVPTNGSCTMPTAACVDDSNEDDDNQSQAMANAAVDGPMQPGTIDAVSCPLPVQPPFGAKSDDDWRQLVLAQDTEVDLFLVGNGESDLDLHIYKPNGTLVSRSTSLAADENIVKCITAGTYYVKVNGYTNARSEYLLDYVAKPQTCDTSCVDDSREDDNSYSTARNATLPYTSTDNKICPNNDDWFKVRLTTGQRLIMDLTFTQSTPLQDLDLHLYDAPFNNLWPCSPQDPSMCSPARGQSGTSNEHAEFVVPSGCAAGCDYYVVVHGWNGSSNDYDISLRVQ